MSPGQREQEAGHMVPGAGGARDFTEVWLQRCAVGTGVPGARGWGAMGRSVLHGVSLREPQEVACAGCF